MCFFNPTFRPLDNSKLCCFEIAYILSLCRPIHLSNAVFDHCRKELHRLHSCRYTLFRFLTRDQNYFTSISFHSVNSFSSHQHLAFPTQRAITFCTEENKCICLSANTIVGLHFTPASLQLLSCSVNAVDVQGRNFYGPPMLYEI
jgi:hypothetical protein